MAELTPKDWIPSDEPRRPAASVESFADHVLLFMYGPDLKEPVAQPTFLSAGEADRLGRALVACAERARAAPSL